MNRGDKYQWLQCTLPDCFCSVDGTLVPGGLIPKDIPQMVLITFDDAVNDENWELYSQKLFPQGGNSIDIYRI